MEQIKIIQCKKCKTILKKPTVKWGVVFHGDLIKNTRGWEIDPWGEDDYIDSLILECDDCGYKVKLEIDKDDLNGECIKKLVKKFVK